MTEMLSQKLKENTKTAHQELEKLVVQKIKSIQDTDDYLILLGFFYRFFAPIEQEIASQLGTVLPDMMRRRKISWILDDLEYFRGTPLATQFPVHIIDDPFQAIGALYVIEGSTLGGQIICKMIAEKLEVSTERGFKFFSSYGDDTTKMWQDFKLFLDNRNWNSEEEKAVIAAANRTFDLFKQSML